MCALYGTQDWLDHLGPMTYLLEGWQQQSHAQPLLEMQGLQHALLLA